MTRLQGAVEAISLGRPLSLCLPFFHACDNSRCGSLRPVGFKNCTIEANAETCASRHRELALPEVLPLPYDRLAEFGPERVVVVHAFVGEECSLLCWRPATESSGTGLSIWHPSEDVQDKRPASLLRLAVVAEDGLPAHLGSRLEVHGEGRDAPGRNGRSLMISFPECHHRPASLAWKGGRSDQPPAFGRELRRRHAAPDFPVLSERGRGRGRGSCREGGGNWRAA